MRTVNNTQHFRSAKVAQPGQTAMSLNNDVVECDGKPAGELTELALYDMPPMLSGLGMWMLPSISEAYTPKKDVWQRS